MRLLDASVWPIVDVWKRDQDFYHMRFNQVQLQMTVKDLLSFIFTQWIHQYPLLMPLNVSTRFKGCDLGLQTVCLVPSVPPPFPSRCASFPSQDRRLFISPANETHSHRRSGSCRETRREEGMGNDGGGGGGEDVVIQNKNRGSENVSTPCQMAQVPPTCREETDRAVLVSF